MSCEMVKLRITRNNAHLAFLERRPVNSVTDLMRLSPGRCTLRGVSALTSSSKTLRHATAKGQGSWHTLWSDCSSLDPVNDGQMVSAKTVPWFALS